MSIPEEVDPPPTEDFKVDEYKDMMKGSFDTGDPLTTNLYVGNINPKACTINVGVYLPYSMKELKLVI